jgi:hypothetical protein
MALIEIVETLAFLKDAERLLSSLERDELINSLAADPEQGVVIKGTGGLRKMRIGFSGRGKRGGWSCDLLVSFRKLPGGLIGPVCEE